MKKSILIIALFLLGTTVADSCKKNEKVQDCSALSDKVDNAYYTYSLYPTTANCQAYKTAIINFINCPAITAQQKATFQLLLPQLTC